MSLVGGQGRPLPGPSARHRIESQDMELGIYTFAELAPDPATGHQVTPGERLRNLIEEIALADQLGLDVSASASITAPTTSSRHRPWCSPLPRPGRRPFA